MNLVPIEPKEKKSKSQFPAMTIRKSGMLTFNQHACKDLNLIVGSRLTIFYDESKKKDLYIKHGGTSTLRKTKGSSLAFNLCTASHHIWTILSLGDRKFIHFKIITDPIENGGELYYPILTSNPF